MPRLSDGVGQLASWGTRNCSTNKRWRQESDEIDLTSIEDYLGEEDQPA
jgi:hypothetical protein